MSSSKELRAGIRQSNWFTGFAVVVALVWGIWTIVGFRRAVQPDVGHAEVGPLPDAPGPGLHLQDEANQGLHRLRPRAGGRGEAEPDPARVRHAVSLQRRLGLPGAGERERQAVEIQRGWTILGGQAADRESSIARSPTSRRTSTSAAWPTISSRSTSCPRSSWSSTATRSATYPTATWGSARTTSNTSRHTGRCSPTR